MQVAQYCCQEEQLETSAKLENEKAGLQLSIMNSKLMTTEELHVFNLENASLKIVRYFLGLGFNQRSEWSLQPRSQKNTEDTTRLTTCMIHPRVLHFNCSHNG